MSDDALRGILLISAVLIWPAIYVVFCLRTKRRGRQRWSNRIAYFILFGEVGGWLLALALSPSPIALVSVLFLATVGLAGCIWALVILRMLSL